MASVSDVQLSRDLRPASTLGAPKSVAVTTGLVAEAALGAAAQAAAAAPSITLARKAETEMPHIKAKAALAPTSDDVDVALPSKVEDLEEALFPLLRKMEQQYCDLPWPKKIKKIVVFTKVQGGLGDISAAAKAIDLMKEICPTLEFDWVFQGSMPDPDKCNPMSFLHDPSNVHMRTISSYPPDPPYDHAPGDFLLVGPVKLQERLDFLQKWISREIAGPTFCFMENASPLCSKVQDDLYSEQILLLQENIKEANPATIYQTLHSWFFPRQTNFKGFLPMGLRAGSGVFLDQSRIKGRLSPGYCWPSYLPQIKDTELRSDILESMNAHDDKSEPDYSQYSFNSGYAHHQGSWGNFIDCVAIHEHNKHVVIVLNNKGARDALSAKEFQEKIFTPKRLAFLKQKGYGNVIFKGQGIKTSNLQPDEDPQSKRSLTVIVRPSFIFDDMRCLQLASERLLATGDNTAVEAWCARCILYLYEIVLNTDSCKGAFLKQQIDLAYSISPNLGKLLTLFGKEEINMEAMERLLNDPELNNATLQFCDRIIENYSFNQVLKGALKRTAWLSCIRDLQRIEAETLDPDFGPGLIHYLKNPEEGSGTHLQVKSLPELKRRIEERVRQ